MEEKQELRALMARLEESSAKQARYGKWQCVLTGAAALFCGAALAVICMLTPKVADLADRMESVMSNLESITAELDEADLKGMVENVDALAVASQDGIGQAVDKLNAIDFDTLNRAIANLADVVEPLARFFNIFNK